MQTMNLCSKGQIGLVCVAVRVYKLVLHTHMCARLCMWVMTTQEKQFGFNCG